MYEDLAVTLFITGYLAVMNNVKPFLKPVISKDLKELMANAEIYWWAPVIAYHAVWLQLIENAGPNGLMQR